MPGGEPCCKSQPRKPFCGLECFEVPTTPPSEESEKKE
jgi:hypothetical protein